MFNHSYHAKGIRYQRECICEERNKFMNKKDINTITKIADLEAEVIELENMIVEHPNSEKIEVWKKDLRNTKTRLTKLRNKFDKNDEVEEQINVNLILQNKISLDNQLAIKKYLHANGECVVEFINDISDEFIRLLVESFSYQVRIDRINNNTIICRWGDEYVCWRKFIKKTV